MFLHKEDSFELHSENMQQLVSPRNMTLQLMYSLLAESAYENRLVQGPSECIDLLNKNLNKAAVCIMTVNELEKNINLSIQLILIESLCQEYGIPIVKVDKDEINHVLYSSLSESIFGPKVSQNTFAFKFVSDLDCCFILNRGDEMTASEKKLMNMIHDIQNDHLDEFYADFPK